MWAIAFMLFLALNAMALFLCPFSFQKEKAGQHRLFLYFVCVMLSSRRKLPAMVSYHKNHKFCLSLP